MKLWGLATGIAIFAIFLILPTPDGLSPAGWRVAALLALMITWWVSEAVPLAATAFLPLILLPLLGVGTADRVAASYASPLLGLVFGGGMIAVAAGKAGLHRKLARFAIRVGGGGPRRLMLALMIATGVLAMWMATSIATIFMLEIGLVVVAAAIGAPPGDAIEDPQARGFAKAMIIGIAYAAAFGGFSTLTGSPVNAAAVGLIARQTGVQICFAQWLAFGLPIAAVGVLLAWGILVAGVFRFRIELPSRAALTATLEPGSEPATAQARVMAVAGTTVLALIAGPFLRPLLPALSDAAVALTGALILFILPSGAAKGERLLSWEDTRSAPWGVLVIIGGALALSTALAGSGLAVWLAGPLHGLSGAPPWLALLGLVAGVTLLTEVVNNFAAMAMAVPAASAVAVALGVDPIPFSVAVTIAASGGFIVPGPPWLTLAVATPPVALRDLVRSGVWFLNNTPLLVTVGCLLVAGVHR